MAKKKRVTYADVYNESVAAMKANGTWGQDEDTMTTGQLVATILAAIVAIPAAFILAIFSLAKGS